MADKKQARKSTEAGPPAKRRKINNWATKAAEDEVVYATRLAAQDTESKPTSSNARESEGRAGPSREQGKSAEKRDTKKPTRRSGRLAAKAPSTSGRAAKLADGKAEAVNRPAEREANCPPVQLDYSTLETLQEPETGPKLPVQPPEAESTNKKRRKSPANICIADNTAADGTNGAKGVASTTVQPIRPADGAGTSNSSEQKINEDPSQTASQETLHVPPEKKVKGKQPERPPIRGREPSPWSANVTEDKDDDDADADRESSSSEGSGPSAVSPTTKLRELAAYHGGCIDLGAPAEVLEAAWIAMKQDKRHNVNTYVQAQREQERARSGVKANHGLPNGERSAHDAATNAALGANEGPSTSCAEPGRLFRKQCLDSVEDVQREMSLYIPAQRTEHCFWRTFVLGNNQRIASGSQDPKAFLQRAVDAYHNLEELDKAHSASENMFRQMTESLRRLKKHEAACSKLYNMVPAHLADNVLDIISGAREVHQVFYAYYNRASEQNRIMNERFNEQRRNVRGGIASALGMAYHAKAHREQMTQAQAKLLSIEAKLAEAETAHQ